MSESEGRKPGLEFPKFDELEQATRRALRQLEVWRERAAASEAERQRLQGVIDKMGQISGSMDASEATEAIQLLREENERLRRRLAEGLEQAEKLVREVEFLEDAR